MRVWAAAEILAPGDGDYFRRMVVQADTVRAGVLGYPPGYVIAEHAHLVSDELFYVIEGAASFIVEQQRYEVRQGDFIFITRGERHEIRVHDDPLVLLAGVAPNVDDAWAPPPAH